MPLCFGSIFIHGGNIYVHFMAYFIRLLLKVTVNGNTFMLLPFGGIGKDLPKVLDALEELLRRPLKSIGFYEHTPGMVPKVLTRTDRGRPLQTEQLDYASLETGSPCPAQNTIKRRTMRPL